jgi:hypothetical protein
MGPGNYSRKNETAFTTNYYYNILYYVCQVDFRVKKPWQNNDVGVCSERGFGLLREKARQIMGLRDDVGETGFFRYYAELGTIFSGRASPTKQFQNLRMKYSCGSSVLFVKRWNIGTLYIIYIIYIYIYSSSTCKYLGKSMTYDYSIVSEYSPSNVPSRWNIWNILLQTVLVCADMYS